MTLSKLREVLTMLEQHGYADKNTEIQVFGVGHGLSLDLTGDFTRAPMEPGQNSPVVLGSTINESILGSPSGC